VAPDTSNSGDDETENVHKLDRLPQRPMTSKAKPSTQHEDQLSKPLNEKDIQHQSTTTPRDQSAPITEAQDEITAAQNEDAEAQTPAVKVDPPRMQAPDSDSPPNGKHVEDEDSAMDDATPEEPQSSIITQASEDTAGRTIPPPPPPVTGPPVATPASEDIPSAGEPQKALLGPIRPEHRGRKCLVLDLDETLVHSSFKVSIPRKVN
jgi:RNA polymerase II subunit A small phosphatase-like protein